MDIICDNILHIILCVILSETGYTKKANNAWNCVHMELFEKKCLKRNWTLNRRTFVTRNYRIGNVEEIDKRHSILALR